MKVLLVEDDEYILNGLAEIFEREGWQVIPTNSGLQAEELFIQESPDLVCLDVMIPGKNGYDVCRAIRKISVQVPILFISAKSEEIDRVVGLELGADDFIVKPFGVREVLARVRAIFRRILEHSSEKNSDVFVMADITIFPSQLRAYRNQKPIELSLREIKILRLLFEHRGKVVDRNLLLDHCWGIHAMPSSRTVDQQIAQLRKRIELNPQLPEIIRTVHGVGYRYQG